MSATEAKAEAQAPELKPRQGLIGFFDILGYQSFLENNSPEYAAKKVLTALATLDENISKGFVTTVDKMAGESKVNLTLVESTLKKVKWLIFSDSILLTLDIEDSQPENQRFYYTGIFLTQCVYLWKEMLDLGLPVRGALSHGPFIVYKTCFAGAPIVEAHKLAGSLNLSAIAVTSDAYKWITKSTFETVLKSLIFEYLTPIKGKDPARIHMLSGAGLCFSALGNKHWTGDLRQLVYDSFWKHKKDIGPDAVEKANNTEQFIRYLKSRRNHSELE